MCQQAQSRFLDAISRNQDLLIQIANKICEMGSTQEICSYFVGKKTELLLPMKSRFIAETDYFCAIRLKLCPVKVEEFDIKAFKAKLLEDYPKQEIPQVKTKPFKALVVGDTHVQPNYRVGADRDCPNQFGCCNAKSGFPLDPKKQAGFWGAPGSFCDVPEILFDKSVKDMKEVAEEMKADVLIVLGDNPAHDFFQFEGDYIADVTRYVFEAYRGNFTIPIIPVFGNHECHPVDFFDWDNPESFVRQKIYPIYAPMISESEMKALIDDGFFEREFPDHNIKLLSFNSQISDVFNDYVAKNGTNPLSSLEKLAKTFYASEIKGQKVIFLTHIPISDPFSSRQYSKALQAIFERFKETFGGMFSSHTHHDHLKFIKSDKGEFIGLNYISPSLTTFASYRPSFRLYTLLDGIVYDYDQYDLDIDEANARAFDGDYSAAFKIHYNFRNEYNLTSLSPNQYGLLYDTLKDKKSEAFDRYSFHFYTQRTEDTDYLINYLNCDLEGDFEVMEACMIDYDSYNIYTKYSERLFRFFFESGWYHKIEGKSKPKGEEMR